MHGGDRLYGSSCKKLCSLQTVGRTFESDCPLGSPLQHHVRQVCTCSSMSCSWASCMAAVTSASLARLDSSSALAAASAADVPASSAREAASSSAATQRAGHALLKAVASRPRLKQHRPLATTGSRHMNSAVSHDAMLCGPASCPPHPQAWLRTPSAAPTARPCPPGMPPSLQVGCRRTGQYADASRQPEGTKGGTSHNHAMSMCAAAPELSSQTFLPSLPHTEQLVVTLRQHI